MNEVDHQFLQGCLAEARDGEDVTIQATIREQGLMVSVLLSMGATKEELDRIRFQAPFPTDLLKRMSDDCNCGGTTIPDTHTVACPSSLYQSGIQRGRREALGEVVAWLRHDPSWNARTMTAVEIERRWSKDLWPLRGSEYAATSRR
jgi:hypothetical protein